MDSNKSRRIEYITPNIPAFDLPNGQGERYDRLLPDTLDIVKHAELAIRFISNITNPDADRELYMWVWLNRNPPVMFHDYHAGAVQPKFLEALPLLRELTGNMNHMEIDKVWMESVLHMQGGDGLFYMPAVGRPWARNGLPNHSFNIDQWGVGDDGVSNHLASIVSNGILMGVVALYFAQTGDQIWDKAAKRAVDRMADLMVYKDDYCYFPILTAIPGTKISQEDSILDPESLAEGGGTIAGWIIHGLSQIYRSTKYQPALELAGKLAIYLMKYSGAYDSQARFLGMIHTHHHLKPMIGLLEYAILTNNHDMIDFARRGYEYARSCGNTTVGYYAAIPGPDLSSALRFSPETFQGSSYKMTKSSEDLTNSSQNDYASIQKYFRKPSEGCTSADMVALGIKLSQYGVADYWDDVDRIVRNHFFESQLLNMDWVKEVYKDLPLTPADMSKSETNDNVAQRQIGNFASQPAPNGMTPGFGWPGMRLMQCCSGNAFRSIYYLWDAILSFDSGTLSINLLLNHSSQWADISSHIPYEGKVQLAVKEPCILRIRIPEWVKSSDTICSVQGKKKELMWEGRYAIIGAVKSRDIVTLNFPIAERHVSESILGIDLSLIIKGNDVVSMKPDGDYNPFYQGREKYRKGNPTWIKRQIFVASKPTRWH